MLYWYIVFCVGWSMGAWFLHLLAVMIGVPEKITVSDVISDLITGGVFAFGIHLAQQAA